MVNIETTINLSLDEGEKRPKNWWLLCYRAKKNVKIVCDFAESLVTGRIKEKEELPTNEINPVYKGC